ncbi:MAG: PKD domain-containing protein, partial [Thaumarchaeota archaeon]|nr:PKD domain-containing protein [Nitrososphaerota archaeon]
VASVVDDGVQILQANQAPTANAGRDITGYFGKTITLDGSSSTDPDGDRLEYDWQQNPADIVTVELINANSAHATFTAPDEPVTLEFTLTVSDDSLQDTDTITITIKERPVQIRNIKDMGNTLASAQITGPNQITMSYYEELSTFINSYLNFTITGEDTPRNIIGIDGSPSKSGTVNIDGKDVDAYLTILTFDGESVTAGSTGSMYIQHADHYLAFIQVSDGQD